MRYKNNPGNIRTNNALAGYTGSVNGFSTFESIGFGYQAILTLLNTYFEKYGLKTIAGIISRYAPPNENQTSNYIQFVANKTGFNANQILNQDQLIELIPAIVKMENGIEISVNEIQKQIAGRDQNNFFKFILPASLLAGIFFILKK
jgi:hypothetical protein